MATFRKRGKTWQAVIRLKDHPELSQTFPTKREAQEWATAEEAAIRAGRRGVYPSKTLDQAMTRYELEVSSKKRGGRAEGKRFAAIRKAFPDLVAKALHRITPEDLAEWRDQRLANVKSGSVLRDISLLRNVWTIAGKEWGWCPEQTPWRKIRLPADSPPREPTWGWKQARQLLRRLGYKTGKAPRTPREEVGYLFLLGLHTGMRQGELHGLTKAAVNLDTRVVRLGGHKTLEKVGVRHVPVPRRAAKVLRVLVDNAGKDGRLVQVARASVDTLFRKYRDQCLIEGLTFHDTRATALTLLSRRVEVMDLARISGHSDLRMLLSRYYRASPESIAARI